jgi:anthranilate synthase component 2
MFADLKNPLNATRYHSLVANQSTLPDCFKITAWTKNNNGNIDEIMGIRHKDFALEGVQFHPESILTEQGHNMLNNFLQGKTL